MEIICFSFPQPKNLYEIQLRLYLKRAKAFLGYIVSIIKPAILVAPLKLSRLQEEYRLSNYKLES